MLLGIFILTLGVVECLSNSTSINSWGLYRLTDLGGLVFSRTSIVKVDQRKRELPTIRLFFSALLAVHLMMVLVTVPHVSDSMVMNG